MPESVPDTLKVFVSYSHKDAGYLNDDALLGFLKGLKKEGVEFWTDANIRTGEKWDEVIKTNLQDSHIALALVSQWFLDSEYCQDVEIRSLLENRAHLFPIIISACEWRRHEWLSSRQFLPGGDETVEADYADPGRRKALYHEIRQQLRERIDIIRRTHLTAPALAGYCEGRIAQWSAPRYALDKRFVHLTLLLDQGEEAQGPRWAAQEHRFQDLGEVLAHLPNQALVLLGPPGSGKSTLLRHFELDSARSVLEGHAGEELSQAPVTFFVPLNDYRPAGPEARLPDPKAWLSERWKAMFPDLPELAALLQARRLTLLLDALNEIPVPGDEPVRLWKAFLRDLVSSHPGNRVIFTCRSLDYSASLSSKDLPVPQVRVEALSDDQVRRFLELYRPDYAADMWDRLKGSPQLELLRSPYYLKLLVAQTTEGEIPTGRAALFTGFVRAACRREINADNPLFQPDELLTQRDRQRLNQVRRWKTPWELPGQGALFDRLSTLAYEMQAQRSEREAGQVRIAYDAALDILDHARDEDILKAGESLGVLEEDLGRDEVLYVHQLLQEYFAARRLAGAPEPPLVSVPWRADQVVPSLEETLSQLADSDPLPLLARTGWEETTLLAAAMVEEADAFVADLIEVNLPLAGRCAAQPDVPIAEHLRTELQQRLIARTQDPQADLRARILAGFALGELGDPRFETCEGPEGPYLRPPLVAIPGGTYVIGSDEGIYEDEAPPHSVALQAFQLAQFPVTNAEWALFMQAGGYDDERWWETAEDQAWRRGEGTAEAAKRQWRELRQTLQKSFDQIRGLHEQGRITSKQADDWEQIARMGEEAFEALLDDWYPTGRQTQPAKWNDDAFNHPAQPVVGVSWFEARAYCAWLSAQMGQDFRLPTEAEWEAAARGREGRRYAYGDTFDAAHANTFETHIRRTTPIGVFPDGETPGTGLVDMTGNTWDWTSSLYRPYRYDASDGREDPLTGDAKRVLRGGSWNLIRATRGRPSVSATTRAAGTTTSVFGCVVCPPLKADH